MFSRGSQETIANVTYDPTLTPPGESSIDTSNPSTTITPYGSEFRINSFFDVFADITLELPPQLPSPITSVGPILTIAVPEASTWAMALLGFAGLAFAAFRRPRQPRSAAAST
jgi:hypothetical protein